jgi:hypothetical protein
VRKSAATKSLADTLRPTLPGGPTSRQPLLCVLSHSLVAVKELRRSFGELRCLPYYCSTAGERSYRGVKANEVRNVTSDRRDH